MATKTLDFDSYFNSEYLVEIDLDTLIRYGKNVIDRKNPAYKIDGAKVFLVDYLKGLIPKKDREDLRPELDLEDKRYHIEPHSEEEVNLKTIDKFANLLASLEDIKDQPKVVKHVLEHDGLFILTEIT